jgi:hypothetical protein
MLKASYFAALALSLAAFPILAQAADVDFNGRWDIVLLKDNPTTAWWLEVTGAGTPALQGKFVGFPTGGLDDIKDLKLDDHQLTWSYENKDGRREYTAKIAGASLQGKMTGPGGLIDFTGYRAPNIRDHDDGTWLKSAPVTLFNGKDLTGWTGLGAPQATGWTVEGGALKSTGHAINLITTGKYWNFILHVEYNVGQQSNSGVGLRGRYEMQILDDFGKPAESHGNGALYSRIKPLINASRKAGEWQAADIRLVGRDVSVTLNGQPIIVRQKIDGLTGIAFSPFEAEPGPIELQGDHGPVQFRNIVLTPLYQPQAH